MNHTISLSRLLFCVSLLLLNSSAFSQTTLDSIPSPIVKKEPRLKFGCGFGLSFVGGTNVSLAPNLTYKVGDHISFGGGVQGSYSAVKNLETTTTFGGNLLAQYLPVPKLTTSLELAELRVSTKAKTAATQSRSYWDTALFVGAGYNIISKIAIGAKYNLLYKEGKSVYTSPIIPFVNITF